MDDLSKNYFREKLKEAVNDDDIKALQTIQTDAIIAVLECQYKTSQRVKTIEQFIEQSTNRAEGAKLVIKLLYAVGGAFGSATVIKLLEIFGK